MAQNSNPETDLVRYELSDSRVGILRLDNGKLNPLSVEVLKALAERVEQAGKEGARVLVVTGNDRAFAAGADITQFTKAGATEAGAAEAGVTDDDDRFALADEDHVRELGDMFLKSLNSVAAFQGPTIAAISGVALGGGCELALACDFRVASARARLGQPEILLGIIPGGGGTQRLARLVGPARAKDLIFSGRSIDAAEAHRIGLVDRVVDEGGDVVAEALSWAEQFAAGPASALSLAKVAIDAGLEGSLDDGLRIEQRWFVEAFKADDARVGVASFLEHGPGKARFA